MLLMTLYTRASSAKSLTEVPESTTDGMSFIYRRNSNGPNTVPCGTPDVTGEYSDFVPSHTTSWRRFVRKDSIQRRTLPCIPYKNTRVQLSEYHENNNDDNNNNNKKNNNDNENDGNNDNNDNNNNDGTII